MMRHLAVHTLLVLACLGWNFVLFRLGAPFVACTHAELHAPPDGVRIVAVERPDTASLVLVIEGDVSGPWSVTRDREPAGASQPRPRIALRAGRHEYELIPRDGPTIRLVVHFVPSATYSNHANSQGATVHIVRSDVPVGPDPSIPHVHWCEPTPQRRDELAAARAWVESLEVHLGAGAHATERIARGLTDALAGARGIPADAILHQTPWAQFEAAVAGRANVWCDQLARIYAFVATAAGIPSRTVHIEAELDGVTRTGHCVAESFDATSGEWRSVDLSSGVLSVTTPSGHTLSTADLLHLHVARAPLSDLTARVLTDYGVADVPYESVARTNDGYLVDTAALVYRKPDDRAHSITSRLRRHVFAPDVAYSMAPLPTPSLGWKRVAFAALSLCVIAWAVCAVGLARARTVR